MFFGTLPLVDLIARADFNSRSLSGDEWEPRPRVPPISSIGEQSLQWAPIAGGPAVLDFGVPAPGHSNQFDEVSRYPGGCFRLGGISSAIVGPSPVPLGYLPASGANEFFWQGATYQVRIGWNLWGFMRADGVGPCSAARAAPVALNPAGAGCEGCKGRRRLLG